MLPRVEANGTFLSHQSSVLKPSISSSQTLFGARPYPILGQRTSWNSSRLLRPRRQGFGNKRSHESSSQWDVWITLDPPAGNCNSLSWLICPFGRGWSPLRLLEGRAFNTLSKGCLLNLFSNSLLNQVCCIIYWVWIDWKVGLRIWWWRPIFFILLKMAARCTGIEGQYPFLSNGMGRMFCPVFISDMKSCSASFSVRFRQHMAGDRLTISKGYQESPSIHSSVVFSPAPLPEKNLASLTIILLMRSTIKSINSGTRDCVSESC